MPQTTKTNKQSKHVKLVSRNQAGTSVGNFFSAVYMMCNSNFTARVPLGLALSAHERNPRALRRFVFAEDRFIAVLFHETEACMHISDDGCRSSPEITHYVTSEAISTVGHETDDKLPG